MELQLPASADLPPEGELRAVYSEKGNMIKWYWDDEPSYAEQVVVAGTWVGTLLRAISDKRVVGVKLHLESVVGLPANKPSD
jgi:hypothetical protein